MQVRRTFQASLALKRAGWRCSSESGPSNSDADLKKIPSYMFLPRIDPIYAMSRITKREENALTEEEKEKAIKEREMMLKELSSKPLYWHPISTLDVAYMAPLPKKYKEKLAEIMKQLQQKSPFLRFTTNASPASSEELPQVTHQADEPPAAGASGEEKEVQHISDDRAGLKEKCNHLFIKDEADQPAAEGVSGEEKDELDEEYNYGKAPPFGTQANPCQSADDAKRKEENRIIELNQKYPGVFRFTTNASPALDEDLPQVTHQANEPPAEGVLGEEKEVPLVSIDWEGLKEFLVTDEQIQKYYHLFIKDEAVRKRLTEIKRKREQGDGLRVVDWWDAVLHAKMPFGPYCGVEVSKVPRPHLARVVGLLPFMESVFPAVKESIDMHHAVDYDEWIEYQRDEEEYQRKQKEKEKKMKQNEEKKKKRNEKKMKQNEEKKKKRNEKKMKQNEEKKKRNEKKRNEKKMKQNEKEKKKMKKNEQEKSKNE